MTRGSLNLVVDTAAAALLTAMIGTGYVLWFVLPPGTNRTHPTAGQGREGPERRAPAPSSSSTGTRARSPHLW